MMSTTMTSLPTSDVSHDFMAIESVNISSMHND
jgi:hypothetical protein